MISEAHIWMDKAKSILDDYTVKTNQNPRFIAFDMIDNDSISMADDILNIGE